MCFFIIPVATILMVLRIPIIRLVYGTDIFGWEATVQTGYVLSGFALGIVFQAVSTLLARSFYALHDTKTPVIASVGSTITILLADYIFVSFLGFDVWALALAFSMGSAVQAVTLFYLINKKIGDGDFFRLFLPIIKSTLAAIGSGAVMYFILKVFDRSVWVKRLSFLGKIEGIQTIAFEKFVLDTRYTVNLLILTLVVSFVGGIVYLGISIILGSEQVFTFFNVVKRVFVRKKLAPIPAKEQEPVSPAPRDTVS